MGLSSYLKHNGIHRKEREALVEYRRATYNRLKGADLLDGLPTAIKAAVYEKRYRAMLDKTNIFRGVPHRVVQAVLSASREEHFLADMRLWHAEGRNALDIARAAGYYDLEARLRLLSKT